MATIIIGGSGTDETRTFFREAYVSNHWNDPEYLHRANQRAREYEESLTGNGRAFYDALPDNMRVSIDVDRYMTESKQALAASTRDMTRVEAFIPLSELQAIQRAPRVMRDYLMAEPTIWREVSSNRLQGYDEPLIEQPLWFKREDGKRHAVDNPHYQQVMVGQDITDGDDIRHSLAYVAVAVGDGPVYANLTEQDRQSVLDVWKTMLEYHNAGHDVTSPGGGMR